MSVVPVHRYYKSHNHFYTTDREEIGTTTSGETGENDYVSEGPSFTVFTHPYGGLVPVYRYYKHSVLDHFYTTNIDEIGTLEMGAKGKHDYVFEGILGYISPHSFPGSVPIHRYYQGQVSDHFYTVDANEIGTFVVGNKNKCGYTYEGVLGYAYPAEHHVVPVYRYGHPKIHDHFYTVDSEEIGPITHGKKGKLGYISEGIAFHVFTHHHTGLVPVHRYYLDSVKDHFYTTSGEEIGTTEIGKTGHQSYVYERVMGYCSPSEFFGGAPVFRYYNAATKDHFYTTNASEIGTTTVGDTGAHGYTYEGILGYVPQ